MLVDSHLQCTNQLGIPWHKDSNSASSGNPQFQTQNSKFLKLSKLVKLPICWVPD